MESRKSSTAPGRRPIQEFSLPDGKRVVVGLPDEVEALRSRYAASSKTIVTETGAGTPASGQGADAPVVTAKSKGGETAGNGTEISKTTAATVTAAAATSTAAVNEKLEDSDVVVVIHGSEDHQDLLRRTHSHHTAKREELRLRHGDAFEEWERVTEQMRDVAAQLEKLADHSTSLNASFSKFGYSSHLRTYGDLGERGGGGNWGGGGGSGTASSAASTLDGSEPEWNDRRGRNTIKLWKRPVVKQYFHRGLLWRASSLMEVMSFELFFDLLYVGILHINGEHLSEKPDGKELLRFIVTFLMSWKIWSDVAQVVSWFETDDVAQRLEILFMIACLLGMTTNMISTFDPKHDTFIYLVGFYLTARLFTAAYFALTAALVPLVRGTMLSNVVLVLIPAAVWVASTAVNTTAARLGLVFTALVLDILGPSVIVGVFRWSSRHAPADGQQGEPGAATLNSRIAAKLSRVFEFYPGVNIEHKVERMNAFVSLVFGYSVVGVLFQNTEFPLNAFLGKAILGLTQAFVFNWLYFEIDGSNIHVHAYRRSAQAASIWQYAHLPFVLGYVIAVAALSKLVVASDVPNGNPHSLTEHYEDRSEDHISTAIRLFYCVGLGVAMASMGLISWSHEHKLPPTCRMPKSLRLANRTVVAIVFCCLSATPEGSLNSLSLVAITTSLTVWVLFVETWGKSCPEETFFGESETGCKGRYTARCSRKQLEEATRSDGEVDFIKLEKKTNNRFACSAR